MQIEQLSHLVARLKAANRRYLEFLRSPVLSCAIYTLPAGSKDEQKPHTEDEIYYVVSGRSRFLAEGADQPVDRGQSSSFRPARSIAFTASARIWCCWWFSRRRRGRGQERRRIRRVGPSAMARSSDQRTSSDTVAGIVFLVLLVVMMVLLKLDLFPGPHPWLALLGFAIDPVGFSPPRSAGAKPAFHNNRCKYSPFEPRLIHGQIRERMEEITEQLTRAGFPAVRALPGFGTCEERQGTRQPLPPSQQQDHRQISFRYALGTAADSIGLCDRFYRGHGTGHLE
jgi:hypothetical protein